MKASMNGLMAGPKRRVNLGVLGGALRWAAVGLVIVAASVAGQVLAWHVHKVRTHETAILVLNRDVIALHGILKRAGYITEATESDLRGADHGLEARATEGQDAEGGVP